MKANYQILKEYIEDVVRDTLFEMSNKRFINESLFEDSDNDDEDNDDNDDNDDEDNDDESESDDYDSEDDDSQDRHRRPAEKADVDDDDESKSRKEDLAHKMKIIMGVLKNNNDNSVNSFNITRSQLSYELYPRLDKDTARSKLSQKILGHKRFTVREINQLFNIISSINA